MENQNVIEIVRFRLKQGVDDEEFLAENRRMEQNFIGNLQGFIHRDTARAENGEYVIVLQWERAEDARASMDRFVDAPETQSFTGLLDMDTFTMTRYAWVDSFGR